MTPLDLDIIPLGAVVEDVEGKEWVYLGYRAREGMNYVHRFALAARGTGFSNPQWVYDVVNQETIVFKFPTAAKFLNRIGDVSS